MKTVLEAIESADSGWEQDEYGLVMKLDNGFEIRIEPLLFGAFYLAVYQDGMVMGEKIPMTLGTPKQNQGGGATW